MGGITVKKHNLKRLLATVLALTLIASTVLITGAIQSKDVYATETVTFDFSDSDKFADTLNSFKSSSLTVSGADPVDFDNVFKKGTDGLDLTGDTKTVSAIAYKDANGNVLTPKTASLKTVPGTDGVSSLFVYAKSADGAAYYAAALKTESNKATVNEVEDDYSKTTLITYAVSVADNKVTKIEQTGSKELTFKNYYDLNVENAKDEIGIFSYFDVSDKTAKAIKYADITAVSYDISVSYDEGKAVFGGNVNVKSSATSGTKKFAISADAAMADTDLNTVGFAAADNDTTVAKITAEVGITEVDVRATVDAFKAKVKSEIYSKPITQNSETALQNLFEEYNKLDDSVKYFYSLDELNSIKNTIDSGVAYYDTFDGIDYFNSEKYWEVVSTWDENMRYGTSKNPESDGDLTNTTDSTKVGYWGIIDDGNGNNVLNIRRNFHYGTNPENPQDNVSTARHSVLYNLKDSAGGDNNASLYEFSAKVYNTGEGAMKSFLVLQYDNPTDAPYTWTGVTLYANTSKTTIYTYVSKPNANGTIGFTNKQGSNATTADATVPAFKAKQYLDITFKYNFSTNGYDITVTGLENKTNEVITATAFYAVDAPVKGIYIGSQGKNEKNAVGFDDISVTYVSAKHVSYLINSIGEITKDNVIQKQDTINNATELMNNLSEEEAAKLSDADRELLSQKAEEAERVFKEYIAENTPLNMMDFEDGTAVAFKSSGAAYGVVDNDRANDLNASSKILSVVGSNSAANKSAAYIAQSYIQNNMHTVSIDAYIDGTNGPLMFFDYKDSENWTAVYPTYESTKLYLTAIGRTSSLALNGSGNRVMKYDITYMKSVDSAKDYNKSWAKFIFSYNDSGYVTVKILFADGNIGEPMYNDVTNGGLSDRSLYWNIDCRSGSVATGFGVGSNGTATAYFDNISINTVDTESDSYSDAAAFISEYEDILKLTPNTLSNTDISQLDNAIADYNGLSIDAKKYVPTAEEVLYTLKDASISLDSALDDSAAVVTDKTDYSKPFTDRFESGYASKWYRNMVSGWGNMEIRYTGETDKAGNITNNDHTDDEGHFLLTDAASGEYYYNVMSTEYSDAYDADEDGIIRIALDTEANKWYYWATTQVDGKEEHVKKFLEDKSSSVSENNKALYMKSLQSFYTPKDKFLPSQRRISSVSMTVWPENANNTNSSSTIKITTAYKDQSNYSFIELYNNNNLYYFKIGSCVDGAETATTAVNTTLLSADKVYVTYTLSEVGRINIILTDQHGNTFQQGATLPNITWGFAISAFKNVGVYYDNIQLTYQKAGWEDSDLEDVTDIVMYYTSNTFLDPDSVVLLQGDNLYKTVKQVEIMPVNDVTTAGAIPKYISRTGYDYNGVVYYDVDGNAVTRNANTGEWCYTDSTTGKLVRLSETKQKWYYEDNGEAVYLEKAATVKSEHHIDPLPNGDISNVWNNSAAQKVDIVQKTYSSLKFILDENSKTGIYLLKITGVNKDPLTNKNKVLYYYLNAPWIDYTLGSDGETTAPGKTIDIIGENLAPHIDDALAALNSSSSDYAVQRDAILSSVSVYMTDGTHNYNLEISDAPSDYRIRATIPTDVYMENGGKTEYEIMVHSNYGDDYTWSIPYKIYVAPDVRDSWGDKVYSIKEFNSNVGNTLYNAAPVVTHAMDYISQNGGGTLYFPAGSYRFDCPIVVPENVRLVGEKKEYVQFLCADYYYEIGDLPKSLFFFGSNAEFKNISVYAERTGGFVAMYGEKSENVYFENCRFWYQVDAGNLSIQGPVMSTVNECYSMIMNESKSFLIYVQGDSSNIHFDNYTQRAQVLGKDHRPIVVYENYAEYWVLRDFWTNGGWGEFYANKSMLDGGESVDCALGAWSHGMYIQDWYFNTRANNNHEAYVADMSCDYAATTLTAAYDENGNRMLDENGLPTVYKVSITGKDESLRGMQVYVYEGYGEGQARTVVKAVTNDEGGKYVYLDRPFTVGVVGGVTRCNIRKNREDIYFVNSSMYNAICFGFYGAACDVVYDGTSEDRFRDFYLNDWSGDVIWYVTIKDNRMSGDHLVWHSNWASYGYLATSASSVGFDIMAGMGGEYGQGAMCIALRNNWQDSHYTMISVGKHSKDIIVEHNYTVNVSDVSPFQVGATNYGGTYMYRNVLDNCGSQTVGTSSKVTNAQGSLTKIVNNSSAKSVKKGDVNLDGNIDLLDVTAIRNYVTGQISLTEAQKANADVDGNPGVTLEDATYLRFYILGYIDSLN